MRFLNFLLLIHTIIFLKIKLNTINAKFFTEVSHRKNNGDNLDKLRKRIDELDAELLKLLNERAKCVVKIGAIKQKEESKVVVPQREKELLNRLTTLNNGPMTEKMVHRLFQEIIDTLKELQE